MKKSLVNYFLFLGTYILIFFILDTIPLIIDLYLGMFLGLVAMIAVLIVLNKRNNSFNGRRIYLIHLTFSIGFFAVTIGYDQLFGLTEISSIDQTAFNFRNSKFYELTLSLNHAVIFALLILIFFAVVKKNWENLLISCVSLVVQIVYIAAVV